jgi:DNA-binding NarL/FixJ family response regulator
MLLARRSTGFPVTELTSKMVEVLQLKADGLTNLEIAEKIGSSEAYVKNLSMRISDRLGADNMYQAVAMGIRRGLIQ